MSLTSSWLYRLGQQTVAHHATADSQRLALMNITSGSQYRAHLERIYGLESAVELRASSFAGLSVAVAGARLRRARLYLDLLELGLDELDIAKLPGATIELRTPSEALGWLFVVERHVLLAGLIRRYLASERRAGFPTARAYLDAHEDGGRRFRDFADAVSDSIVRGDVRPDAVLLAARGAFDAQRQWYARPSRRPRPATSTITSPESARPQTGVDDPTHPRRRVA